jgi:hypothetical protein
MSTREPLVTVCTAKYMEAQIIKGRLESEGIPVLLSYESAGLVYGLTIDGLGEVKIMVPKHLAEEAREILREGDERQNKNAKCEDEP